MDKQRVISVVQVQKTKAEVKFLEQFWCSPRFAVTEHSPFQAMFNWALHAHTNMVD